jgi:hypothetical protein
MFSPLYSRFHVNPKLVADEEDKNKKKDRNVCGDGYCRTAEFGYRHEKGIRLALAMAISGSALGSNMGRFTSASRRFLNTVINLRLGWWLSNPRYRGSWGRSLPRSRLQMLMAELIGNTHDVGPFINLSDGGHFDNSGLYELIRRNCKVIIVSDASADQRHSMASIRRMHLRGSHRLSAA